MMSTVTSSYEVPESVYEDPDALLPAITHGKQLEVRVKPVPRPRSKLPPKTECNTNHSSVDSADKTNNTTNAAETEPSAYPADYRRPSPVRPPPRPPLSKSTTSCKSTAGRDGGNYYIITNSETTVQPPAVSTENLQAPPPARPERPPLPSIYYERLSSTLKPKSQIYTDENQQSRCSSNISLRQSPLPPSLSGEVNLCGSYSSRVTDCTDRPAVPPRLWQSSLPRSAPELETSPPQESYVEGTPLSYGSAQTRPPVPAFDPPPPPSIESPSESVYSEIEYRPYLDILPEDDDDIMTQGTSTLRFEEKFQSGHHTSQQQTTKDTEDINGMLRWLKRVSKSDVMAPSLYGLSIEEEISSFNQRAMNVRKALRLYNLLMLKRNESLRDLITEFTSISHSLDKMQKKSKTIGIAGGTTGAVGGVTAVLGIALAPVTMGASLIATAVGAGMVASAGGVGVHAAQKANKKIVNKMTVEKLVYEYKSNVVDLEHCLDFILSGMNELRRHDIARLQRAGAQTDSLKMAHLSQFVIRNSTNNERKVSLAHAGGRSSERLLQAFAKEMDQYFSEKDDQKLKKSNKSRFSGRVCLLAENLQDELDHLNQMWEMFS